MRAARVQVLVTGRRIGPDGTGPVVPGEDPEGVGGGDDDIRVGPVSEVWCRLDGDGRHVAPPSPETTTSNSDDAPFVPPTATSWSPSRAADSIDHRSTSVDGHLGHRPRGAAVRRTARWHPGRTTNPTSPVSVAMTSTTPPASLWGGVSSSCQLVASVECQIPGALASESRTPPRNKPCGVAEMDHSSTARSSPPGSLAAHDTPSIDDHRRQPAGRPSKSSSAEMACNDPLKATTSRRLIWLPPDTAAASDREHALDKGPAHDAVTRLGHLRQYRTVTRWCPEEHPSHRRRRIELRRHPFGDLGHDRRHRLGRRRCRRARRTS